VGNTSCIVEKKYMEQAKQTQLAYEIATALNDLKSIDWHISNSKRYPESVLRETLAEALTNEKVKSPKKYYNWSLQQYDARTRN
jgi:hypothetical protein